MRKVVFVNGHYYHVYNRGVDKRKIFLRHTHYIRFLRTIKHLLVFGTAQAQVMTHQSLAFNRKLSFMCYCLMPNHYHFVLKQLEDDGISDFMHGLNTSYTKFFNTNQKRTGRLFEYTFKAVEIESDEQLLHASRYIHLNPLIAGLVTDLSDYQWSSFPDYCLGRKGMICQKSDILRFFSTNSTVKYHQFISDQTDYAMKLEKLKQVCLDESSE